MTGISVSDGIAHGTAFIIAEEHSVEERKIDSGDLKAEVARFLIGRDRAAVEYEKLILKVRGELGDDKAEIFEGHLEILTSDDIEEGVIEIITEKLICAEKASEIFAEEMQKKWKNSMTNTSKNGTGLQGYRKAARKSNYRIRIE
jgi:phosphotransferase system enzyme I (PtsI)